MSNVLEAPSWMPQVADVAAHLLSRTRQTNGDYAGTFNSMTFPTDVQVQQIIAEETALIRPKLGDVPDHLADSASALLALKAACCVEESCFPEQVEAGVSAHAGLVRKYQGAFQMYFSAAEGDTPNAHRTASLPCGTLYPGYETGTY